jgi:hypothetical protein
MRQRDTDAAASWLRGRGIRSWFQLGRRPADSVPSLGLARDARATILRAIQLAIECRLDEALCTFGTELEPESSCSSSESDTIDYRTTMVGAPQGADVDDDPIETTSP